MKDFIIVVLLR